MTIRLAVFDCDGTLSDGQSGVCEAMETAFADAGLPSPDRKHVRRIVGLSLPQAIRHLAPGADADQQMAAVDAYKSAFRRSREEGRLHEPLFDGMADLLHRLQAAGWLLGVATGKSDRGLAATLAANGLTDMFVTTHTADRHPSKPHPAMLEAAMADTGSDAANTVMIGDTVYDMQMASAAGTRAVGVDWGYHERGELIEAGASGVAEDAAQLEAMLDGG
ncbi:HAD-IA family hydrolase [Aurantiacibacter aquimixticola]|uniref:HAD family hydrolase n=1 Tax=Aurantiacibacter aquimixticola TaxID=1958945 RepID=A0A419RTF6_9SPHN|nr:HAD-IA family hydrolase [Aurantiacibacter aquimixticola]RJY09072.1 HAD family hydrolase [Aurantiacibacter aquimixticola]